MVNININVIVNLTIIGGIKSEMVQGSSENPENIITE